MRMVEVDRINEDTYKVSCNDGYGTVMIAENCIAEMMEMEKPGKPAGEQVELIGGAVVIRRGADQLSRGDLLEVIGALAAELWRERYNDEFPIEINQPRRLLNTHDNGRRRNLPPHSLTGGIAMPDKNIHFDCACLECVNLALATVGGWIKRNEVALAWCNELRTGKLEGDGMSLGVWMAMAVATRNIS